MRFSIELTDFLEIESNKDQLAVCGSDKNLTWEELRDETFLFEQRLKEAGIKEGQAVAIWGHKEAAFIPAICACIRLKCPYIPLDSIYPAERIAKIQSIAKTFCLINVATSEIQKTFDREEANTYNQYTNLIYIIFTSGSTGEPKGVQIPKEGVLHMLSWMRNDFKIVENPIFMNQAPFSFDLSVYELMYSLHFGGTLVLNDRKTLEDKETFVLRLKKTNTDTWVSTPSFAWQLTISENFNSSNLPNLQTFLFCGEVLPVKLAKKLRTLFPSSKILNTYGPTEATVATTLIEITDHIINQYDPLPIGYPMKGTEVYVDSNNEICILGPNVMMGYLNREDLNTSKMFALNKARGFKTGDLGYIKDSMLFCQGRMDDQIKLHGYRIELSEIDNALTLHPAIANAACIPIKRGDDVSRIVSFVKRDNSELPSLADLKEQLLAKLPQYMIPSEFLIIEEFPFNNNHKIDRKKLSEFYKSGNYQKWPQL